MGNHFHVLLRVPEREKFLSKLKTGTVDDREAKLLEHLSLLYSEAYLKQLKAELAVMREKGMTELLREGGEGVFGPALQSDSFYEGAEGTL
jgi:putative transposase